MEEFVRQPKNLGSIFQESLGHIGHRIERWDILKDGSLSLEERKEKLIEEINNDIHIMEEIHDKESERDDFTNEEEEILYGEMDALALDAKRVSELEDDPQAIEGLYNDRVDYYTRMRREYIKNI